MAFIAPFYGLRFNTDKITRMEDVVTPPYDVIDERSQADLLEKNPYNMIQLDLSKNFTTESLTDERYQRAKGLFELWQKDGVLIRDDSPTIYLYYIDYTHPSGRRLTRKGLVSLVGLAEFSEGIVKPHEKTFREVTGDRLRLIDTCQAQFSKIFSLYPDENDEVIRTLEAARPESPLCSALDQDGCKHTIWAVTDQIALKQVQKMFKDKPVYIADGHHRYTTALQLRELMHERQGEVAQDSPYNHTMMYLCGMEDPGLSVLPTHRFVRMPGKISAEKLVDKLKQGFQIEEISSGSRESLVAEVLNRMDENNLQDTVFGFYHPGEDRCFLLTLDKDAIGGSIVAKQPEAFQQLDVVILSDLVLEQYLGLDHDRCENEKLVDYYSDPDAAIDEAVKVSGANEEITPVLFLMNHTPVHQVKEVADQDLVMPHKSTYFYPKILTGLLINKIVAEEKIR